MDWNWHIVRVDMPQNKMRVSERERPARAVARGTWCCSGALRTNSPRFAVPPQNRATTRGHTFNGHAWRRNGGARHGCLVTHFRRAVHARDIGACAAHVQRDAPRKSTLARNACRAGNAASRSRQQTFTGRKCRSGCQAARAGHHKNVRASSATLYGLNKFAHWFAQRGVHHRRARARFKAACRATFM